MPSPLNTALVTIGIMVSAVVGGCALRSDPMLLPVFQGHDKTSLEGAPKIRSGIADYGQTVLVAIGAQSAAVIEFLDPFDNDGIGVNYRYRFVRKDGGSEIVGAGMVREKRELISAPEEPWPPGRKSAMIRIRSYRDAGTLTTVKAGDISFEWSLHDMSSGWIYFQPAQIWMRVARHREFESLDLKRAVWVDAPPK